MQFHLMFVFQFFICMWPDTLWSLHVPLVWDRGYKYSQTFPGNTHTLRYRFSFLYIGHQTHLYICLFNLNQYAILSAPCLSPITAIPFSSLFPRWTFPTKEGLPLSSTRSSNLTPPSFFFTILSLSYHSILLLHHLGYFTVLINQLDLLSGPASAAQYLHIIPLLTGVMENKRRHRVEEELLRTSLEGKICMWVKYGGTVGTRKILIRYSPAVCFCK